MATLDLNDIQGIIVRGYGVMKDARFLLLRITDARQARQWLGALDIMDGQARPSRACLNVGFTHRGLKALEVDDTILDLFSDEFKEGLISPHRTRILGDRGKSAPDTWVYGGPHNEPIHVLLMLYARDIDELEAFYAEQAQAFESSGLVEIGRLDTILLKDRKEHFGFRDGIGQPLIEGLDKDGAPVKTGEFILGYINEHNQYTDRPLIDPAQDPNNLLPEDPAGSGQHDMGRNGTYLVLRTLRQDVQRFWQFLDEKTKNADGSSNPEARIRLASKMVGRWPSGAPLILSPDKDDPSMQDDDAFLYFKEDPYGQRCPLGSHIRRTNTRDSIEPDPGSAKSIAIGNLHRIVRRGRAYGPPIAASMDSSDILEAGQAEDERGLHFVAINANLRRQYEFIQQTWSNSRNFNGLYNESDPIIGDPDPDERGDTGTFTVQAAPLRQRITGISRFVDVRGGGYFFLPGLRAARYLASL